MYSFFASTNQIFPAAEAFKQKGYIDPWTLLPDYFLCQDTFPGIIAKDILSFRWTEETVVQRPSLLPVEPDAVINNI